MSFPRLSRAQAKHDPGNYQKNLFTFIREKHGLDQDLIRGIQYVNLYHRIMNHPYYGGEGSFPGNLVLAGKKYNDVRISYDLYEQHLVLEYRDLKHRVNKIIISPELTDAFELDRQVF